MSEGRPDAPEQDAPEPDAPRPAPDAPEPQPDAPEPEPRPMIERIGLALVALVLASLFGAVGVSAWVGGEGFLSIMGFAGALMTLWVGGLTLIRG